MPYMLPGEMELLQQMIEGDAESFRKIYEFYQERIFLFAFRLTKSKAAAEEIVQEVFVKLWEKRDKINTEKNFNAYIFTIAKNLILDGLKKAAHDKNMQQRIYNNMLALQSNSVDKIIEKELARLHRHAVERLSPQRKIIFMLSREEELSYDGIAKRLGISKNTVRNQMADALKSIREYLSNHSDIACVILAITITVELF